MKWLLKARFGRSFRPVYAPDDDTVVAGSGNDTTQAGSGNDTTAAGSGAGGTPPPKKPEFTAEQQQHVNSLLAAERRKLQAQNEKTVADLQKLQQEQGITSKKRDELQARINELQQQFMSKEEIAKQERERESKEYANELKKSQQETEHWKRQFQSTSVTRALQDAALEADAYSPGQIISMLGPNSRLVEELDAENKPTGRYAPRVRMEDTDANGNLVELDLTVKEAITKMKNTPERFGNLFKSGVNGGLGRSGSEPGNRKKVDPKKMTTAEFMEARKKDPSLSFAEPKE